jgi:cell surface protein SprA
LNLSYFALNTFFQDGKGEIINLFRTFERNRLEASDILGQGIHGDSIQAQQGYTQGYGRVQQDVLIASFMAAYQGKTITEVGVQTDYVRGNLFKQMPFPNWRLTYNGLSKLPLFKTWFQSINISHGYSSKLQINTFNTDLDYLQTNGGLSPNTQDFYSQLEIPEIVIQEAFSPLLGIDIRTQNDMSINFSFTKSRTLAMSFVSYQLAETQQQDYTFGFGWKMQEVNIGFLQNMVGNNPKNKKATSSGEPDNLLKKVTKGRGGASAANVGDLDIKIDFSWRDNITFNHILDQNIIEPTRGTRQISFSPSAQYQLHDQLALRLFFDYNRTVPKVSTSFPITNTSGGVVLRFSLN